MTKIAISPMQTENGHCFFSAIAGNKYTKGKTAGEALDALTAQLNDDETGTLVIVQNYHPDRFFNATQKQRLKELMELWRIARDNGRELSKVQQQELEELVELELLATAERAAQLSQ